MDEVDRIMIDIRHLALELGSAAGQMLKLRRLTEEAAERIYKYGSTKESEESEKEED